MVKTGMATVLAGIPLGKPITTAAALVAGLAAALLF